jgi:hypothetical protein
MREFLVLVSLGVRATHTQRSPNHVPRRLAASGGGRLGRCDQALRTGPSAIPRLSAMWRPAVGRAVTRLSIARSVVRQTQYDRSCYSVKRVNGIFTGPCVGR